MNYKRLFAGIIVLLLMSVRPMMAVIRLGAPFGEHMVLQQGVPIPIWGAGCPGGDTVNVSIAGQSVTATSDWTGRWMVTLAPMKPGGPYQMLIQIGGAGPLIPSSAANDKGGLELNDVVVGEVRVVPWQFDPPSKSADNRAPNKLKPGPQSAWIRVFKTSTRATDGSQTALGRWSVATPVPALDSWAASQRYDKLRVPIGVIESPGGLRLPFN